MLVVTTPHNSLSTARPPLHPSQMVPLRPTAMPSLLAPPLAIPTHNHHIPQSPSRPARSTPLERRFTPSNFSLAVCLSQRTSNKLSGARAKRFPTFKPSSTALTSMPG